jgi:hypothetical protein|tara:strand:+ start:314 stop:868 length:555 start_codon:yes stop_codon:yes gene_type:complete
MYAISSMENDMTCNKLLDDILSELEEAKEKGTHISDKLNSQTDLLHNTIVNIEKTDYEADTSTWHINYIKSTFGKIYKKIHSMPSRIKSKSILHKIGIRDKLSAADYKSKNIPPATDNDPGVNTSGNNKFSQIFNTISDIKYISKVHKNELEKHNTILDYTSELVDTTEDKIFRNQLKIKKILD